MKNFILFSLFTTFLFSCESFEEEKTIIVQGKIENADVDSVFIIKENFKKGFALNNGEFKDTLKINKSSYFQFFAGREGTHIFLQPGDSLNISTDIFNFDKDLKFGGTSEKENNFLAHKHAEESEKIYSNPQAFFSVDQKLYKNRISKLRDNQLQLLESGDFSTKFKEFEKKNIEYQYYIMLAQFPMAHSYFTKNKVEMPKEFESELSEINLDNKEDFMSIPTYHDFVVSTHSEEIEKLENADAVEKYLSEIKTASIKDALLSEVLLYRINSGSPDSKRYNEYIQENAADEKLKNNAKEAFANIQKLLPGQPSPTFKYPDINGKNVSLKDLKGNLVYIDVWATWCGPCLAEIPSMKKLEGDYRDKKIKFVGMSIDPKKDKDKWKQMVKEKDLKGIQIFADNDWKSQFVKEYGILGIPRFILIDAEGNIINADAPRPSDPAIRTLFDEKL